MDLAVLFQQWCENDRMAQHKQPRRSAESLSARSWHAGKRREHGLVWEKPNWLRKKDHNLGPRWGTETNSETFRKIFLDSNEHFGNHDLVIALPTTVLTRYRQTFQLPQGN